MQHNDYDVSAKLHAFLIAAKFKLEMLMNEERFKFIKDAEERGVEQPGLKGKAQFDAFNEYSVIDSLYKQFNQLLQNIHSTSFNAIQNIISKAQEDLDIQNTQAKALLNELAKSAVFAEKYLTSQPTPDSSSKIISNLEHSKQLRKKPRTPAKLPENKIAAPAIPARKTTSQTNELTDVEILSLQKFLDSTIQTLQSYVTERQSKINQFNNTHYQRSNTSFEGYNARLTKEKCDSIKDLIGNLSELNKQLNNQSGYTESIKQIQNFASETEAELHTALRIANTGSWSFKKGRSEELVENLKKSTQELMIKYQQSEEVKKTKDEISGFKPHSQY